MAEWFGRLVLWPVAISGCGRLEFQPLADAGCVVGPFGAVQSLTEINSSADEQDAELSSDGLEIFFRSTRPPGTPGAPNVWRAVRTSVEQPFGAPAQVPQLDSAEWEGDPMLSADGLTMWFTRGPFPVDIYTTTRIDRDQPFALPTVEPVINSGDDDASPWVNADGTEMYFASNRMPFADSYELWHAIRPAPAQPFGAPVRVDELAAPGEQCCATLSPDGQELLFASATLDLPRTFAIGHARWQGSAWGELEVFAPTASTSNEGDVSWSRDGRSIIFSSDRPGGLGMSDLYMIERACQ